MQESYTHAKYLPSVNMVDDSMDPYNNSNIQRLSYLETSTKHQYLIGITILIPTSSCFDVIMDLVSSYDTFT